YATLSAGPVRSHRGSSAGSTTLFPALPNLPGSARRPKRYRVAKEASIMWVTRFFDPFATTFVAEEMTLKDLAGLIDCTEQPTNPLLPMLKLARFGGQPSAQGALRHDGNILTITGVEGDYDDEQMPVSEAVKRLENAGIAFIVYTSPSHGPLKPRWRV